MQDNSRRRSPLWALVIPTIALVGLFAIAAPSGANHNVHVEGETDWDGDGLLGADENTDGDFVFGTINGALQVGLANAVNQNGRITIETSGRFLEGISITASGNVIIEAAPGVAANIEAFHPPGDDPGNTARQNSPGVVVDSDGSFVVVLRNLTIRNWTVGVLAQNASRVTVENCSIDSNVSYGVQAVDSANIIVVGSTISGSGFRNTPSPDVDNSPSPGVGIGIEDSARAGVFSTIVSHSAAAGIANQTGNPGSLRTNDVAVFDSTPRFLGHTPRALDTMQFVP